MRDFIPIAKPIVGDEEINAVGDVLEIRHARPGRERQAV